MAAKPVTNEKIALTEKKMDMTLDDIIKMSKNNTLKPKKQQRVSNRNQKVFSNTAQNKSLKVERFMDSRSYLRQAALARRRSNFQGNQFPFTSEAAKRVYVAPTPIHNRPVNPGRAFHNKPRARSQFVQKPAGNGGSNVKEPLQQQAAAVVAPRQKPQTLDSLFASMKEQRMMKNTGPRRNGGGQNGIPWFRNRNFSN